MFANSQYGAHWNLNQLSEAMQKAPQPQESEASEIIVGPEGDKEKVQSRSSHGRTVTTTSPLCIWGWCDTVTGGMTSLLSQSAVAESTDPLLQHGLFGQ